MRTTKISGNTKKELQQKIMTLTMKKPDNKIMTLAVIVLARIIMFAIIVLMT